MTAHAQFVRVGKLNKVRGVIKLAARHNLREIAREIGGYGGIDGRRVHLNQVLRGSATADGVAAAAQALLDAAGIKKLRKNAVPGIEAIISLHPSSKVNQAEFFADSLAWLDTHYRCPIVSAVLHLDEEAPHLHALILPLVDGRMRGSDLVGNKFDMLALQNSFREVVGKPHGLTVTENGKPPKTNPRVLTESGSPSLCSVGFEETAPLGKHQRMELLTRQFTIGIQQKLARGSHRWTH